ncbi:MAG: glutamine-hydrolyzing carbamoyl-phosphate synthase small subunit [Candidatus Gastranaerophilales bacterium]|nr:glutamine-hydrolyzing carbamoyl-phosphate synthase small subunit [Candidatus Gastranaerophilales bacterium]
MSKARILFQDGKIFEAEANLNDKTVMGELVFNTAMTGYQEILTDPSYASQIVIMTYPLIGNYGIDRDFAESAKIQAQGFIIKENAETALDGKQCLSDYLAENEILCLSNIDTRKLTKIIRSTGSKNCLITTEQITEKHRKMLADYVFPKNIVETVSEKKTEKFEAIGKQIANFALIDYGVKNSIVKSLREAGAAVTVYPYNVSSKTILGGNFDAVMLSNGPGDPKDVDITKVKELLGKIAIFGICLGNQIAALAVGADTFKMKFGHRGANHPVINTKSGKVLITSQNHGYAVNAETLPADTEITYLNINDNTVEGFEHKNIPLKCVQFHPEAAPGPEDAKIIFKEWINFACREGKNA